MVSRREFLRSVALGGAATALSASIPVTGSGVRRATRRVSARATGRYDKVLVLGMDGMDPGLVRRFAAEGSMPTFAKMLSSAHFGPLQTTMPAQSPVAWASFATGTDPAGHGIYDFIHRDPASRSPFLSTSRSFDSTSRITAGDWSIPLGSGSVRLMRQGTPFWSVLEQHGIPATVYQIPSNFPVLDGSARAISGMGTPDLIGSYGTFTYFSEAYVPNAEEFTGGRVARLRLIDHRAESSIVGPHNPLRSRATESSVPVRFVRDPSEEIVKIELPGRTLILRRGEWSEWIPLQFEFLSWLVSSAGMVRFYLKEVHPKLKIYCSPVNVDPIDPALPICSPAEFSAEVASHIGRFYTQGLPADTKALSLNVLDDQEYFSQAMLILEESMRGLDYTLSSFDEGLLFFYFSSIDQNSHMLMRAFDPRHPQYNPHAPEVVKNAVRSLYRRMDDALAMALRKVDSRTLLVALSDHGFNGFYREFHLNNWLMQQGFLKVTHPEKLGEMKFYDFVDWEQSQAYAIGFNGLYINRAGREKRGGVSAEEASALKRSLISKLREVRDPRTGGSVVAAVYDSEEIYRGPFREYAPDLLVGYAPGYRVADESALGRFGREIVADRTDKWSADHCIDHIAVPGMLLVNRELNSAAPAITDLAPTILKAFSLDPLPEMTGRSLI